MNIQAELIKRSLEENIRLLNDLSPSVPHSLMLINYNSLMDDFYKGTITAEIFEIRKTRIWESLFFFSGKLKEFDQQRLINGDNGQVALVEATKKRILYIAASPIDIANLQVDFEFKKIKASIEQGALRDNFELLLPLMSVTLEDFLQAKFKYKPSIIHFSGHGLEEGLMFATSQNVFQVIPTELLDDVFKGIEAYTQIIILNACYASAQAEIISKNGVYVLGMNAPVTDTAALYLSENFYRFVSDGQNAEEAFKNIKILLELNFSEEAKTLEMWKDGKKINGGKGAKDKD